MKQKNRPSHARFLAVLEALNGNRDATAAHFGVARSTLQAWMSDYRKHGLRVPKAPGSGGNSKPPYTPTRKEIRDACAAIRATWTDEDYYFRGCQKSLLQPYEIPHHATSGVLSGRKRRRA